MNYIWEIVLRARENYVDEKELFFKQAFEFSPYYEQSFLEIDRSYIEDGEEIEVNALYRFDKIFNKLLAPKDEDNEELKNYMFDIAIHFLVNVDLYSGLSRQDIYLLKIKQSIQEGEYGIDIANIFRKLEKKEKDIVVIYLLKQLRLGSSLGLIREMLKNIYKDMLLYQMKTDEKLVLLYLGIKKNEYENKKVNILIDLFLPVEYRVRIFWEYHFGVIDIDETMLLDNVELF